MDLHVHFRRGGKSNNKGSNGNQLTKTEGEKMDISPTTSVQRPITFLPNDLVYGARLLMSWLWKKTNIKAKPFPKSPAINSLESCIVPADG